MNPLFKIDMVFSQNIWLTTFDGILMRSLLLHILAIFSKINDFIICFIAKKVGLDEFSSAFLTFSRNSANSAFSFWLYISGRKRRIYGNFLFFNQFQIFLTIFNIWYYIDFRDLECIPLRDLYDKTKQFSGFLY